MHIPMEQRRASDICRLYKDKLNFTECVTNLDWRSEMNIFESILTTFESQTDTKNFNQGNLVQIRDMHCRWIASFTRVMKPV